MSNPLQDVFDAYIRAEFQLADMLYTMKQKHGRKSLVLLTGMDISRINSLCAIGSFTNRNHKLQPLHYLEVVGLSEKEANKFLTQAVQERLSPCQLRKRIRDSVKNVKTREIKKTNKFVLYHQLLQRELNNMAESERVRAKEMLKNI